MKLMITWSRLRYRAGYLRRRLLRHFTRWQRLSGANPLGDLEWNELPGDQGRELNHALVSLVAFDPAGNVVALGSGFIVVAEKTRAIGVTAAHVLWDAAHKAQHPNPRSHPSTPDFFRPDFEVVYVGPNRLRAVFMDADKAALPSVSAVVWDKKADVAFFWLHSGDDVADAAEFQMNLPITDRLPSVGQIVGVLGYADMSAQSEDSGAHIKSFSIGRRLVLRVGRVVAHHPEGHWLCRGPCIETTIPVFPGMSGGAAFIVPRETGPIEAFGVVSADPEAPIEVKQNRWTPGASIIALLPVEDIRPDGPLRQISLKIESAGLGRELDGSPAQLPQPMYALAVQKSDERDWHYGDASSVADPRLGCTVFT